MIFPTTQLDLVTELFVNGGWVDISSDVWLGQDVTIAYGRPNESGQVSPASCALTLKNTAGNYNPRNPLGAYFGTIGRNTPIRVSVRTVRDAFGRTSVDSWGSADTGEAWTIGATTADYDVNSGVGKHAIPGGTRRASHLAGLGAYRNYDVVADVSFSPATPSADAMRAGILLRATSTTSFVTVRVNKTSGGVITLAILDTDDTTFLAGPSTIAGVASGTYRLRAQVEGATIRAKMWNPSGNNEPYAWHLTGHSTAMAAAGWMGLRSASDTDTVTASFDNLEVRLPRFFGEVSSWPPRWDQSANRALVPIEAGGILRRLSQGESPERTSIERYVVNNATQPLAYWPLDDGDQSLTARIAAGSGIPAIINFTTSVGPQTFVPARAFGSGVLAAWLNPAADISHNAFVRCALLEEYAGAYTAHCAIAFTGGRYADVLNIDILTLGNIAQGFWSLFFVSQAGTIEVVRPDTGLTIATITADIYDDGLHHIGFRTAQNGTGVDWTLFVDGAVASSGTAATLTNPRLLRLAVVQNVFGGEDTRTRSIGHVALYAGNGPVVAEIYDAFRGHSGEPGGDRLARLCAEEDIAFGFTGALADTGAMGPQYPDPLLTLLAECADTDVGTLLESRGALGLGYRTRRSLENQIAALALSLTAGHLSAPIEPVDDDQATRNDITLSRRNAGSRHVAQATGPLSTANPQDGGVGRYDIAATVNSATDDQLADIAAWLLHLGTVDEPRYPHIRFNLENAAFASSAALTGAALGLASDDRVTVANLSGLRIYDEVSQLARGMSETLNAYRHQITLNCAPESPYHVVVLDSAVSAHLHNDATALNEDLTTTETGADVAIASGPLWTTASADWPFDIVIGGEHMTVTAISGASSPQTFTVTRSVNGVVKTHPTGATVALADTSCLAL